MQDLWYPGGSTFAKNRSICNGFRNKQHSEFPGKFNFAEIRKIKKKIELSKINIIISSSNP